MHVTVHFPCSAELYKSGTASVAKCCFNVLKCRPSDSSPLICLLRMLNFRDICCLFIFLSTGEAFSLLKFQCVLEKDDYFGIESPPLPVVGIVTCKCSFIVLKCTIKLGQRLPLKLLGKHLFNWWLEPSWNALPPIINVSCKDLDWELLLCCSF